MASCRRRSSARSGLSLRSGAGVPIARTVSAAATVDSAGAWIPDDCKEKALPAHDNAHACMQMYVYVYVYVKPWIIIHIAISIWQTSRKRVYPLGGKGGPDGWIIVARKASTHPGGVIDVWWRPEIIGLLISAPFSEALLSNLLFSSWSCNIIACK